MKGVQCYEFFGGIALKNHALSLLTLTPSGIKINGDFPSRTQLSRPSLELAFGFLLLYFNQEEYPDVILRTLSSRWQNAA